MKKVGQKLQRRKTNPEVSIALLKALHTKWTILLKQLSPTDLKKEYIHPETKKHVRLDNLMGMYAWHGDHHLTHITALKGRKGW